jgi:hypothetical protein
MAVLQGIVLRGIVCHDIYFDKLGGKFCAIAELPSDPACHAHNDYLYVAASSAAELILIGNRCDEGSQSDHKDFASPGAPTLHASIDEAQTILLRNKRRLKRLVAQIRTRLERLDYDLDLLPEKNMAGMKLAELLSRQELEDAVRRN